MKRLIDKIAKIAALFSGIQCRAGIVALFVFFSLWSIFRGLQFPLGYAIGQWLFNYRHGFIKRGMVGTLFSPLTTYKSHDEISEIIKILATLIFFGFAVLLVRLAYGLVRRNEKQIPLLVLPSAVFFSSSFLAVAAFMNGYLDHFLEILTVLSVVQVARKRFFALPFIAMFALSVHELFIVYGFPVIFFSLILQLVEMISTKEIDRKRALLISGIVTLPTVLFYLFIVLSGRNLPPEMLTEIEKDIRALGVFGKHMIWVTMFHLTDDVFADFAIKIPGFWRRIAWPGLAREIVPSVLFIAAFSGRLLAAAGRARWIPLMLLALLAPLAIQFVAWDVHRFANFIIFHAFMILVAAVMICRPIVSEHRYVRIAVVVLCLAVLGNNLFGPVSLSKGATDREGIFVVRTAPVLASFIKREPLFPNSGFETRTIRNWRLEGDIPTRPQKFSKTVKCEGVRWYGSYSSKKTDKKAGKKPIKRRAAGDRPKGVLTSIPFEISQDHIMFLVGGGAHKNETYVALEVEGKERYRAWGRNSEALEPRVWDVSAYKGKKAVIRIVDNRSRGWGHINADGFCYWR